MVHLLEAIQELRQIESKFGVSIVAKARAYGAAWLAIRDRSTGEIFDVEEVEHEAFKLETQKL